MKKLIGAAIVVPVLGAGFLAYRVGWLGRLTPGAGPPGEAGPAGTAAGVGAGVGAGGGIGGGAKVGGGTATTSGSGADIAAAGSGAAAGEPTLIPFETLAPGGNIARLDLGAVIESTTRDDGRDWSALFVLDENARSGWQRQTSRETSAAHRQRSASVSGPSGAPSIRLCAVR